LFLQCLFLQILVVNKVKDQVDQVQMVNKAKVLMINKAKDQVDQVQMVNKAKVLTVRHQVAQQEIQCRRLELQNRQQTALNQALRRRQDNIEQ
jgi:aspartyl/asparaginyl-tRNA synthetase